MVSVERCDTFTKIDSEVQYKATEVPESWPQGAIEFRNVSLRYRHNTPLVISNLSFEIKSKQKIGIAGRTGSGKSSIVLGLFRIIEAEEGQVLIDGIDTKGIDLK